MRDSGAGGTAARIRAFRVRAGRSKDEMAQRLALNPAWYEDLEQDDAELASTLNLFQALDLASVLGVELHELFPERPAPTRRVDLVELPDMIEAHLARTGVSLAQLEERAGWPLDAFMTAPVQTAAELPLTFLQSLASELALDWLSLTPETNDSSG
jgi:transcriptional regulator with XRE-family HTH domain